MRLILGAESHPAGPNTLEMSQMQPNPVGEMDPMLLEGMAHVARGEAMSIVSANRRRGPAWPALRAGGPLSAWPLPGDSPPGRPLPVGPAANSVGNYLERMRPPSCRQQPAHGCEREGRPRRTKRGRPVTSDGFGLIPALSPSQRRGRGRSPFEKRKIGPVISSGYKDGGGRGGQEKRGHSWSVTQRPDPENAGKAGRLCPRRLPAQAEEHGRQ